MHRSIITDWLIFFFAVFGGFIIFGFMGAAFSGFLGVKDIVSAGFSAAFWVVVMSYLSAPVNPKKVALIMFIIGGAIAWYLLKDANHFGPENTHFLAPLDNRKTYIPFISTILGGILALAIIFFPKINARKKT